MYSYLQFGQGLHEQQRTSNILYGWMIHVLRFKIKIL